MSEDIERRGDAIAAAMVIMAALVAVAPLFADPGFLNTRGGGDSPFLLFRLHQMAKALADGHFPVRWMPDAAYGLGYPFFHFYAALPFYVACVFRYWGFSYVLSLKLSQLLGFLLAAWAMWIWARKSLRLGRWGAMLASAAYTFAPFHMVNVYVRGDSLSEFWAFVFYPFVLRAIDRLIERPRAHRIGLLGASYGALLLTHNISALIFTPFALLYALIGLLSSRPGESVGRARMWVGTVVGFGLGLAVSSWFWLPALMDRDLAQLGPVTTGYFHYGNHFRAADLVQSSPTVVYVVDGPVSPFSMGLGQAVLCAIGMAVLISKLPQMAKSGRGNTVRAIFPILGLVISTLMITPFSGPLWDHLPLLPFVQFPWRFLSVQALFTAALAGYVVKVVPGEMSNGDVALSIGFAVLLGTSALWGLRPDFIALADSDVTPARLQLYELTTANIGTTVRHEYLPAWVRPRLYAGPEALGESPRVKPITGSATGIRVERSAIGQVWNVDVESEQADVAFPLLYWPGWRAELDGRPVPLSYVPGPGWTLVTVPNGRHTIELRLRSTPSRAVMEGGATLAMIALVVLCVADVRYRMRGRAMMGIWVLRAASVIVAVACVGVILRLAPESAPPTGPMVMDYAQEGYFHHEPDGLRFEGGLRLLEYEVEPNRVAPGGDFSLRMRWESGEGLCGGECPARVWLISPAETTQGRPARLSGPEVFGIEPTTELTISVPDWTPPGFYLLRLSVFGPDGHKLRSLTGAGDPRVDTALGPIWVEPPGNRSVRGDGIADFGALRLLSVSVEPVPSCRSQPSEDCDGRLDVRLEWEVVEELPRNYSLGLRLRDPDGNIWAEHDAQMGNYGFYPTALWESGTLFRDWTQMETDPGIPPGADYRMSIAVYDSATMYEIGRVEVGGVTLPALTAAPDSEPVFELVPGLGVLSTSGPEEVEQGEPFTVRVRWVTGRGFEGGPERISWRMRGRDGVVWEVGLPPAPGSDVTDWPPDATIEGRVRLTPPPDVPPGEYVLEMAVSGDERWHSVLSLRVRESSRLFEPPDWPGGGAEFGGKIGLWGYRVEQVGDAVTIDLAWGALEAMTENYYFFVHLFDPETGQIVAQRDAMPRDYAYPTSLWAPGEVVVDEVTLPLEGVPPGEYRLRVGWYVYGGSRLSAKDANDAPLPDDCLVLDGSVLVR